LETGVGIRAPFFMVWHLSSRFRQGVWWERGGCHCLVSSDVGVSTLAGFSLRWLRRGFDQSEGGEGFPFRSPLGRMFFVGGGGCGLSSARGEFSYPLRTQARCQGAFHFCCTLLTHTCLLLRSLRLASGCTYLLERLSAFPCGVYGCATFLKEGWTGAGRQ